MGKKMKKLLIEGGKLLQGHIHISGSKNLCISLIPAALLSRDIVILKNVPPIADVFTMIDVLKFLNVTTIFEDDKLIIDAREIEYADLVMPEINKIRASYYFMGALTGLFSHLKILAPGGCKFGARPIDFHLSVFEKLGVSFTENENAYDFRKKDFHPCEHTFAISSVGATINAVLLASQIKGTSIFHNIALEPEVCEFLKFMAEIGVEIEEIGLSSIKVKGGNPLHGGTFEIIPDRIEAGTYALIGAAIGDPLIISPVIEKHLEILFQIFSKLQIYYHFNDKTLIIWRKFTNVPITIKTGPFPMFPTDLQQPITSFLARNEATSIIEETIYEDRFAHIPELNKMGADIIRTKSKIVINGRKNLIGANVTGKDLRGGASLVIAGLMAEGKTIVEGLEHINRGYQNLVEKLVNIGAQITLITED